MPDDVGEVDPALAAALAAGDLDTARSTMLTSRLLVPVVATGAGSDDVTMAVPALVGADGRRALPVFSSVGSLRAWRADARPVPMAGEQAVAAAVDEGYDAVVLDVAGPVMLTVEIAR
jgi:hypothetical protein